MDFQPTKMNVLIAQEFIRLVRVYVGEANWRKVVRRNSRQPHPNICHTHDFCDANMFMADAIERVTKRRCTPGGKIQDKYWNNSWDCAKVLIQVPDPINSST